MTTPLTLRLLLEAHPALFYRQEWYLGEAFLDEPLPMAAEHGSPTGVGLLGGIPDHPDAVAALPHAVTLARAFCEDPTNPIWRFFLWCRDTDARGQRVYVGGATLVSPSGLQIHRHLHIDRRWGVPRW